MVLSGRLPVDLEALPDPDLESQIPDISRIPENSRLAFLLSAIPRSSGPSPKACQRCSSTLIISISAGLIMNNFNNLVIQLHSRSGRQDRSIRVQQRSIRLRFEQVAARRHREEDEATALLVSMAFAGGPIRQLRTYLTRGDLPGNPMSDSAWAYMFSSQNDRAFITTMGVDVATFNTLLKPFADRDDS
ncbi:hypothetical protein PGT21_004077 [Puccinia graminis f. sp. tritici]|uniref:Uncharacterized protein n=1 Tax=Puccinia graminis f. sp. tritici TaxID=56615 RepID=A0A5B0R4J3_PUCGR|nr:hypothetical protein PGT21_004077 [Puccinia graminis f. sp. tritici]KAA1120390.1 hypothetical protein PGTUg99_009881 [Puccinia graminis f. sp. tritici]